MIRLLPLPWEGLHPAFPAPPDELPANPSLTIATVSVGTVCGLSAATLRYIFRRPASGVALRTAAISSVATAALVITQQCVAGWKVTYPFLRREGLEPRYPVLLRFNGTFSADDAWIAGACAGALLAASSRKFPGATGWKRYVGGATFGSSLTLTAYFLLQHERLKPARERWKVQQMNSSVKMAELALQSAREQAFQMSTSGQQALQSPPLPQANPGYSLQSRTQEASGNEGPRYELGKYPHWPSDNDDDELEFQPRTDYHWSPNNPQEGITALEEHIQKLMKKRQNLIEEAEYVWHDLARREHLYPDETNAQKKVLHRKALEWLSSVHSQLWGEISSIDWMLADSRKRILQLDARRSGKQWLPDPAQKAESKLESVVKKLQNHLENTEKLLALLEELIASEQLPLNDDVTEVLEGTRLNVEASAALLREYEKRLGD